MGLSVDRCISDRLKSIDYTREEHLFFGRGRGGGHFVSHWQDYETSNKSSF